MAELKETAGHPMQLVNINTYFAGNHKYTLIWVSLLERQMVK